MFRMGAKFKRIVALIMVMMLTVLLVSSAVVYFTGSADRRSDLEDKKQSLSDDKEKIKEEMSNLDAEKKTVMEEKKALDVQVTTLEGEISDIDSKIAGYETQIEQTNVELENAQVAIDERYEAYKARIRVMYESGSTGYLDVLLSSKSIGDFFEKLDIVSQIAEYDQKLIEELKAEQQRIMTKKAELETLKQALVDSKETLETKKSSLDAKMGQRDVMIQEIESSKSSLEAQLKEIEAEEDAVRAQIAELSRKNSGVAYSGGKMVWPTPSCYYITSEFGWRFHPVLKYEKLHTGFDIGAGYGAEIVAAASGEVITATYNGAYGNYVVIDHGGGVCTLYAHQSSMAVSVGQKVSAGQTIGYVGSTGYSTGPHLHFEVIVNGEVQNPRNYL